MGFALKYKINRSKLHIPLWSSFFIYKRTIKEQVSQFIVVYVVHAENMTFMYGIPLSIKFIAVAFEVGMFKEIKLS